MRTRLAIALACATLLGACIIGPKQDDPAREPVGGTNDAGAAVPDAFVGIDVGFGPADTASVPPETGPAPGDVGGPPFDPCHAADAASDADAGDASGEGGVRDAAGCGETGVTDAVTGG